MRSTLFGAQTFVATAKTTSTGHRRSQSSVLSKSEKGFEKAKTTGQTVIIVGK
jgi:hypothetical protein